MLFLFQGCLGLNFEEWTRLSRALTMDRIAGLQDLQDRLFWRCCGLTMDRIAGFTGFTGWIV
jgi:hypothetical protein